MSRLRFKSGSAKVALRLVGHASHSSTARTFGETNHVGKFPPPPQTTTNACMRSMHLPCLCWFTCQAGLCQPSAQQAPPPRCCLRFRSARAAFSLAGLCRPLHSCTGVQHVAADMINDFRRCPRPSPPGEWDDRVLRRYARHGLHRVGWVPAVPHVACWAGRKNVGLASCPRAERRLAVSALSDAVGPTELRPPGRLRLRTRPGRAADFPLVFQTL